jgi:hypothetical protein
MAKAHRDSRPIVMAYASGFVDIPSLRSVALIVWSHTGAAHLLRRLLLRPLTLGFDISSYLGFRYKPIDKILTVLLSPQFVQFVSSLANPLLNLVWRLNRL